MPFKLFKKNMMPTVNALPKDKFELKEKE